MKKGIVVLTLLLSMLGFSTAALAGSSFTVEEAYGWFKSPDFCGKALVDCPEPESVEMQEEIAAMVKAGKTKDEIIDRFVDIYGYQILAAPPKKGFFLAAWIMPVIGIIVGSGIMVGYLQKTRRKYTEEHGDGDGEEYTDSLYDEELDEEMKKYF
ncbi:MAG: cytochrome c-type biogenesis protein CcmH [Thermoanaerobacteraceae bacterium]|nr:cytochrome c-type biogenesis protein CcmH [Thermoanaerobacteraceae bacterium]